MEYLAISSDAPGTAPLVLIDGPPYEPWVVIGTIDVGAARWETAYTASHGTRGPAVTGDRLAARTLTLTLRGRFTGKAAAAAAENELATVLDEVRRHGGWLTWRAHGSDRRAHARIMAREYSMEPWGQRFSTDHELKPLLAFTVEPYLYGDPMDWADEFADAATLASEYTASPAGAGTLTTVTAGGRDLAPTGAGSLNVEHYLIHTGSGYDLGDTEARIRFRIGAAVDGFATGVVLKYLDPSNMVLVNVVRAGGSWTLAISTIVAGSLTVIGSSAITAPVIGLAYWVQGRIEGGVVTAEYGVGTLPVTPATTVTAQLSGTALTTFGATGRGKAGIQWKPQNIGDRLHRFMVEPFTYRAHSRYPIQVCGDIPGTAPAVLEVDMTSAGAGPWLMFAASPRPRPWNLIHNEGFEVDAAGLTGGLEIGWSVAAVSGVTGAASSIARTTAVAYEGYAAGQVVTPATANTGASYRLAHRFLRGRTYRFTIRARAATATTNVRVRLGVSGDIASSTPVALSTGWVEHTVDWTPAATVNLAYAAIEVTAATATTFQIDRARVWLTDQGQPDRLGVGHAGRPPWGLIDGLTGFTASGAPTSVTLSGEPYAQLASSVGAGGATYGIAWAIDPALIPQDDHAGPTRDVEVWARLLMSDQFTGGVTALLSVAGSVYTYEWGIDGVRLVMPNASSAFRIYRLGTIALPDPVGEASTTLLQLGFGVNPGTNLQPIGVDWLWLTNPRQRVLTPTAIDPDDGYPALRPDGRINANGQVTGVRSGNHQHLGSVSGGLELPTGPIEVALMGSNAVPDAPTPGGVGAYTLTGTETAQATSTHLIVRPRFEFMTPEE